MYAYLVVLAWLYVALLMAVAEATSPIGSVLGAIITFLLYGVGPAALLFYILGTPARKRALKAREAAAQASISPPDTGSQTAADTITPVRKEP